MMGSYCEGKHFKSSYQYQVHMVKVSILSAPTRSTLKGLILSILCKKKTLISSGLVPQASPQNRLRNIDKKPRCQPDLVDIKFC